MHGLVVAVQVKEGDEVEEEAPLVVLEAMKMQNALTSPIRGRVEPPAHARPGRRSRERRCSSWNDSDRTGTTEGAERREQAAEDWQRAADAGGAQEIASGPPPSRVEPLYAPEDLPGFDPSEISAIPGAYPFVRGIQPTMYRGRLWTMRQYAGFGSAEETNRRFRYLLEQGQTGLSVAFDLPTQMGYDSDRPRSPQGEVGKVGVAIDSLEDMETLFSTGSPSTRSRHR